PVRQLRGVPFVVEVRDALRSERPHVQPDRGLAGAAVEGEGDRAPRRIGAVFGVRGEEEAGARLPLVVLHDQQSRAGGVVDGGAIDGDGVLRGGDLVARVGGRLSLARLGRAGLVARGGGGECRGGGGGRGGGVG